MSTSLPTGVRALLGLAALAVEEVRKLPETLPTALTTVPVGALSNAMQASLKFQQQVAMLATKGDEVISQFKSTPSEPPAWATFDEDEPSTDSRPLAAFERIDYDDVGFGEAADEPGEWDAVGAATVDADESAVPDNDAIAPPRKSAPRKKAAPKDLPKTEPADNQRANKEPAKKGPVKKTSAKRTPTTKASAAGSLAQSVLPGGELGVPGEALNPAGPAVAVPPAGPAVPGS
jgi:hypothetical protein